MPKLNKAKLQRLKTTIKDPEILATLDGIEVNDTKKQARRARQKRGRLKAAPVFPEVGPRRLVHLGKSWYITIPPAWLKAHNLDPSKIRELLVLSDTDIAILHPRSVPAFTRKISRLVRPAGLPPHKLAPRRKPAPPRRPRRPKKPAK